MTTPRGATITRGEVVWVCLDVLPRWEADAWAADLRAAGLASALLTPDGWGGGAQMFEAITGPYTGHVALFVPQVQHDETTAALGLVD